MKTDIQNRAAKIKLLLLDVDGVLTDGKIYLGDHGEELKSFHIRDGSALVRWQREGLKVALISGRSSGAVDRRARELGISEVYQGISDKLPIIEKLMVSYSCGEAETAYIGDDQTDLPVFGRVGFSIAVEDAHPAAVKAADYRTISRGGEGAVMEVIELILACRK
jgi:3-deoxy-D-manno-octulosonate 8-phosphate phosphatase (KDO 8-P phosphatase)